VTLELAKWGDRCTIALCAALNYYYLLALLPRKKAIVPALLQTLAICSFFCAKALVAVRGSSERQPKARAQQRSALLLLHSDAPHVAAHVLQTIAHALMLLAVADGGSCVGSALLCAT